MINYVSLQGTSASGKGTRTLQFIQYLCHNGFNFRRVFFGNDKYKYCLGIEFPELNLLFIGSVVKSRGGPRLFSWSSGDRLTTNNSKYFKFNETVELQGSSILPLIIKYSGRTVIVEGYPGTCPEPSVIAKALGPDAVKIFSLRYDSQEQLIERCYGRTGSRPKGKAAFNAQRGAARSIRLAKELGVEYEEYSHTVPVTQFGEFLIRTVIGPDKVNYDDFVQWSKENSYLRHVEDSENYQSKMEPFYEYMNGEMLPEYDVMIYLKYGDDDKCKIKKDGKDFVYLFPCSIIDQNYPGILEHV